jgi:prepilin-type processing-associated H-X9-DG protein
MIVIGDSEIINPIGLRPDQIVGSIGTPYWFENLMYNELTKALGNLSPPPQVLLPADKAMLQRHVGRWNVLFCDGHVESMRIGELISRDDEVLRIWSRDNQSHRTSLNPR